MSRSILATISGLAFAVVWALIATPVTADSINGAAVSSAPHIVLVHGGGGGGGGGGGHGGFGGGGGGAGHGSFGGGSAHAFAGPSIATGSGARSFDAGSRSLNVNGHNFDGGNHASFDHGGVGYDGLGRGGWNHGNWVWHGNGYYGGYYGRWWGGGYPFFLWVGDYGWYSGYDYGYGYGPYCYYDDASYADSAPMQSYTAETVEQLPSQTPSEGQGSEYLDGAIRSFQSGDYRNAMRMGEHAIVDSPRDAEAHAVVALAAFASKDYRTAAAEYHAVVGLGGMPSWDQLYAIYQGVDGYTSQLRALEDYVKEHPKAAEGQFLLGALYMSTGYTSDAHEHFAKAAELTPKDKLAEELLKATSGKSTDHASRPEAPATEQ